MSSIRHARVLLGLQLAQEILRLQAAQELLSLAVHLHQRTTLHARFLPETAYLNI